MKTSASFEVRSAPSPHPTSAEALDCAVLAWAARQNVVLDVDRRENELRQVLPPVTAPTEIRSPWVQAW